MADICPCTVRQSSELEAPDCSSFVRVPSLASTKRHGQKFRQELIRNSDVSKDGFIFLLSRANLLLIVFSSFSFVLFHIFITLNSQEDKDLSIFLYLSNLAP